MEEPNAPDAKHFSKTESGESKSASRVDPGLTAVWGQRDLPTKASEVKKKRRGEEENAQA
jgi:hypothetical protein